MAVQFTKQPEYLAVQALVAEMDQDGQIERFQGACVPASEIIQAILHARGVRSRLLECTALVVNSPVNGNAIHFIGFDSLVPLTPHDVDTHMVVLVEAETPFIIDASIGHKMGNAKYVIVAPLSGSDPEIIAEASFKGAKVTYRLRKNVRYQNIHQKTLVERMESERKMTKDIDTLYLMVKALLGFTVFNMTANIALIVLKMLYP